MRTIFTLTTLLFVFIGPYWLYLPLIFIGIILFPLYLESIGLALLADILYGGAGHGAMLLGAPFTVMSALFVMFAMPLREHLRFNA